MTACSERLKGHRCSFSDDWQHTVHVAMSPEGTILARWRMEAVEMPMAEAVPRKIKEKYL